MGIVVFRVDDRLVHGQVVIGWGRPLEIDRIVLVDAEVAASEFEQDLYRMAAPAGIEIEFLAPEDAPARVEELAADPDQRTLVLTGSIEVMADLARATPRSMLAVNLGGIHAGPGRREYLRYVYLSDAEVEQLESLVAAGIDVSAQDLPTSRPIPLKALRR